MQEHIPNGTELREFLDAMVLPFDGVCELWMRSLDDYMKARDDPLYKEKIEPDIMYFTDFASLKMAVGKETLVIEDGKALPTNTWKG